MLWHNRALRSIVRQKADFLYVELSTVWCLEGCSKLVPAIYIAGTCIDDAIVSLFILLLLLCRRRHTMPLYRPRPSADADAVWSVTAVLSYPSISRRCPIAVTRSTSIIVFSLSVNSY